MEKDESSLRLPRKPTGGAVTAQRSSIAAEIKLSLSEEEITTLLERNRELEAENAILRERETALARDGIEVLNVVIEALRAIHPGKETAQFVRASEKRIKAASSDDRPLIVNSRIKAAAVMIRDAPTPLSVEGEDRFTYSVRTRTENRALALVDYMKRTETPVLKSTEARHVLQGIEGKPLDRKIVHRALNAARGIIRASSEVVGGVSRIVLQSTARPNAVGGGRPVHPDWNSWRYVTPPDGSDPLG